MTGRSLARVGAWAAALGMAAGWWVPAGASPASSGHHRSRVDSPKVIAADRAGVDATIAFNHTVGTAVVGFDADLQKLSEDLSAGDTSAAEGDELAAQERFDVLRFLGPKGSSATSPVDGLASAIPAGQHLAGLHLVEQDLWGGVGDPGAAVAALLSEAPLMEETFLRLREAPATIVSIATSELGWVNEVAIPGKEEVYSHLDSADVVATVDAAHAAYLDVAHLARIVEPRRAATVARRFKALLATVARLGAPGAVPDGGIPAATWQAVAAGDDATGAALAALGATLVGYGPRQIYGYDS